MSRAKFERSRGVLIDRTRPEHTTFIHPVPTNATEEAINAIGRGDYGAVVPLLTTSDIGRLRPILLGAARRAVHLEPNLAQALALVGGVEEARLLHQHLRLASAVEATVPSEDDQLRLVYTAHALLRLRPSLPAARMLRAVFDSGTPWARELTARLISDQLIARPTVRVERILVPVLRRILSSDDRCFANAIPAALQRHFAEADARCRKILRGEAAESRERVILGLLGSPYYGLGLLLDAFRAERQLELRLTIARNIAPALTPHELVTLIRAALGAVSPSMRLDGAQLLQYLDAEVARELSRRKDPEPEVERALDAFRS